MGAFGRPRKYGKFRERRQNISHAKSMMHTVIENGIEWDFTPFEMWMRAACDLYLNVPIFPAVPDRVLYGYTDKDGEYIPPLEVPWLNRGQPVMINSEQRMARYKNVSEYVKPGAVWMTRRLLYMAYSDAFNIVPGSTADYDYAVIERNYVREQNGLPPIDGSKNRAYHPGQGAFQKILNRGVLFKPEDIGKPGDGLLSTVGDLLADIDWKAWGMNYPYTTEIRNDERMKKGITPKSQSQYMIHPEILEQINRMSVWDEFRRRRAEYDPAGRVNRNRAYWGWIDLYEGFAEHQPVFDIPMIMRRVASGEEGLGEADDARIESVREKKAAKGDERSIHEGTVRHHINQWLKAKKIRKCGKGIYMPVSSNSTRDYKPDEAEYLSDWFWEFVRRQCAEQIIFPDATFDLDKVYFWADRFAKDHPDIRVGTPESIRVKITEMTQGRGKIKTTGIFEKVSGSRRRVVQSVVDRFIPPKTYWRVEKERNNALRIEKKRNSDLDKLREDDPELWAIELASDALLQAA